MMWLGHHIVRKQKNFIYKSAIGMNRYLKTDATKVQPEKIGFVSTLKKYGMPYLVWWSGLYGGSFCGIYAALEYDYIQINVVEMAQYLGLEKFVDLSKYDPKSGNLVKAFVINEIVEIGRFPLTIITLPLFLKLIRRK